MKISRVNVPMRFFLAVVATILAIGIWHTGFAAASWVFYLVSAFFTFAAATGICPGMIFANALFGHRDAGS